MLLTWDGTFGIVIRLQAGQFGAQFGALIPVGARDFFSPLKCPDWFWGHCTSISVGTRYSFSRGKVTGA